MGIFNKQEHETKHEKTPEEKLHNQELDIDSTRDLIANRVADAKEAVQPKKEEPEPEPKPSMGDRIKETVGLGKKEETSDEGDKDTKKDDEGTSPIASVREGVASGLGVVEDVIRTGDGDGKKPHVTMDEQTGKIVAEEDKQ